MSIHRIRLRGPWMLESSGPEPTGLASPRPPRESRAVHLPRGWIGLAERAPGTVSLSRRFHKPTNLDSGDEVDIVFEDVTGAVEVALNGAPVLRLSDRAGVQRAPIRSLMNAVNTLSVTFEIRLEPSPSLPLWREVFLEIRGRMPTDAPPGLEGDE